MMVGRYGGLHDGGLRKGLHDGGLGVGGSMMVAKVWGAP